MRIRKLELQGFKSFADRAVFHFGPGISGVVGPNGCGKSNIVDAVKWCIGEQSAKSLRGDSMSDVIFGGSAARSPVNLAEVSLTFVATDEPFPGIWARFGELDVTRRLYRDGHSEYLINQERVRLRDFHDLFMDTGVGNQLYSFIEQGRIGQIVHARPEQRRTLIEEAAGISRYKLRRQETMEKLDSTRESLDRVADLAEELGRQLRSAERAVRNAARWRMLHAKVRQDEIAVALVRCAGLVADRKVLSEQARRAKDAFDEATRAVDRHEEDLAKRRVALEAVEEELGRARDQLAEREAERRVEESALQYQAREAESARARLARLDVDQEELRRERDAAQAEAEARTAAREAAEVALGRARTEADRAAEEARVATVAVEGARARLAAARREAMEAFEVAVRARAVRSGMEGRRADLAARAERHALRRTEATQQDAHVEEEIARIGVQLGGAEAELGMARREVDAAVARVKEAEARRDRAQAGVREREQAARAREQAVFQKEQALTGVVRQVEQVRARVDSLAEVLKRNAGAPDGVRAALAVPGVVGVLAAELDVPEALEGLLGRALEGGLDTVVVPDRTVAATVAATLGARRARVLPLGGEAPLPGWASVVGGTETGRAALGQLLRGVEVADSVGEALASWSPGRRIVTRDGSVLREDGVLVVGQEVGAGAAALRQRRDLAAAQAELGEKQALVAAAQAEVTQARDALPEARAQIERAVDEVRRVEEEIRALGGAVEAARAGQRSRELAVTEIRHRLNARQADKAQAQRLAAQLVSEEQAIRQAGEALDAEDARAAESIRAAEARQGEAEAVVREAQRVLETEEPRLAGATERVQRFRMEASSATRELATHAEAQTAARARAERAGARSVQVAAERTDLDARLLKLAEENATSTARAQVLGEEIGALREGLERLRESARDQKERVRVAETTTRAARDRRDQARDALSDVERKLSDVRASLERVRGEAEERSGVSLPALLDRLDRDGQLLLEGWEPVPVTGIVLPEPVPVLRLTPGDLDRDVSERVASLAASRDALSKLGEVNLAAEDEYREVAERHADIDRQRQDLVEAMRIIEEAIARINKTCRERFRETFDIVNENFGRVYPRLVGGGSARLQLTDEEDLLTCGVDIVVQPPGKRIQNLTLLSGGEKAMAAIGLIFSLFLVKPSPFCLLDEVDAPLDEGNGARFNEMLKEMSKRAQFIVVTHNKKTMEAADVLYGVTMPEPGTSRLVTARID